MPGILNTPINKGLIILCWILFTTGSIQSEDKYNNINLPTLNTLTKTSPTSQFILSINTAIDTTKPQPLFLAKKKKITVLSTPNDFSKEINQFESFRNEYKLFWTIFNIMFVTHIAWHD